jgi:hypothetical protein
MFKLSQEQARTFGAAFTTEEIRAYIAMHRAEFEAWLSQETQKEQATQTAPVKRRNSHKSKNGIGGVNCEC